MGMFVNSDNSAFQVSLNSEIYVDKTGLLEYTNKVMNTPQGYICNSRPRRFGKSTTAICLLHIIARDVIPSRCFLDWKLANVVISKYT